MARKETTFTQCKLKRITVDRDCIHVAWIPFRYAKIGNVIKIKSLGEWTDGWQVVEIYGTKNEGERVLASIDHKNQRKMSDV